MKNRKIRNLLLSLCVILTFSFISCATSVKVNVVRPAELDLNGANSIAILPFRPTLYHGHYVPSRGYRLSILDFFLGFHNTDPEEQKAISLLRSEIEDGLMGSKYLKLISATAVEAALRNSEPVPADVYLTGEVISFDVRDKRHEYKRKVKAKDIEIEYPHNDGSKVAKEGSREKEEYEIEEEYVRYVDMEFRYQIVDSKTNEIISYKTVSISENSSGEKRPRDLPSPYSIIKWNLESRARQILREIQPYVVTRYLDLLSYSSKHIGMKYADELAEDGLVKESYEKFYDIYKSEGIFEAGYNAAILLEALGKLEDAEALMLEVSRKGTAKQGKKARSALNDIRNEIKQAKKLDKQNMDREGSSARTI